MMGRWICWLGFVALLAACGPNEERVVVHRSNCLVCHQPMLPDGTTQGIEEAHPWYPLTCVQCHGGDDRLCDGELGQDEEGNPTCDGDWEYSMDKAHVSPGDGPTYLKNLPSVALDAVSPEYMRFINPGDLRVVDSTCGVCHANAVASVRNSTMAHTSGEITVARYRGGLQEEPHGVVGAAEIYDPNPDADNACGVAELALFNPAPLGSGVPGVAEAQEQYMVKSCMRCHLNDFGENRFPGDFRSSGCTACHMNYANDGLSKSADPFVNKYTVPHPTTHQLVTAPTVDQCTHCHYRGGRIGISYQGYRESAGAGLNPKRPIVLGQALHGHDANYYLVEEEAESGFDETPPDLHWEAGMHCVDCHTKKDIHGDGHIYADTQCAVSTRCEDCHGTVRETASLDPERPNITEREGELYLLTKVTGKELRIPQTKSSVTSGHPDFNPAAEQSMGVHDGFSHTDTMECYTCHAGWQPSCYGCHVDLNLSESKAYQTTGEVTAGRPTGRRRWVSLNDMVLIRNSEGKMAPSMPAERFFMSVYDEVVGDPTQPATKQPLYETKPRTFVRPDGTKMAGFGQRAFNPHTTRRKSQFMACDRCHTKGDPESPDNEVLLDITHGFGSNRYPQEGCDVTNEDDSCDENDRTVYQLDAIQKKDGTPLVVIGHPDPLESRPLNLEEIAAMRAVLVPDDAPYSTPEAVDAFTNPNWPPSPKLYPSTSSEPVDCTYGVVGPFATTYLDLEVVDGEYDPGALISVAGSGPNDVWTVGGEKGKSVALQLTSAGWKTHETGIDAMLWWVHVFEGDAVFVAGEQGALARYSGGAWEVFDTGLPGTVFFGVWGSAPDDVWAVGGPSMHASGDVEKQGDVVLHFDGTSWERVLIPALEGKGTSAMRFLYKAWGTSKDHVVIVGNGTDPLHWDGVSWTPQPTPLSGQPIFTVTGRAADDMYAVGGIAGAVIRWDGEVWSALDMGELSWQVPPGIWTAPGQDIYISGPSGQVARLDCLEGWEAADPLNSHLLHGIWGDSQGAIYTVGGDIMTPLDDHKGTFAVAGRTVPALPDSE
jgi:hypothetical protein